MLIRTYNVVLVITDFAVFMIKNLESGKTPAHLVEEYYKQLGEQASM
jgi:hypothetical protein